MAVHSARLALIRRAGTGYLYLATCPGGQTWELRWGSIHNPFLTPIVCTLTMEKASTGETVDVFEADTLPPGKTAVFDGLVTLYPGDRIEANFESGSYVDIWCSGLVYSYPDTG